MNTTPQISAVIFDMDGTIIDSEKHWAEYDRPYLQILAPDMTDADYDLLTGSSIQDIYDHICDVYGADVEWEDFATRYDEFAFEIFGSVADPIPGALETIAELHERGVPLALASSANRSWIDMVLQRFGLEYTFEYTVSAQELDEPGKPEPYIFLRAADALGIAPDECMVVEDSQNGVRAGNAAGMYCIGFRNGHNDSLDLSAAQQEIRGYAEFPYELLGR